MEENPKTDIKNIGSICRANRWLISLTPSPTICSLTGAIHYVNKEHEKAHFYAKSVSFDFKKNQILFSYYDDEDLTIFKWATILKEERQKEGYRGVQNFGFKFQQCDDLGNAYYEQIFTGLEVVGHLVSYDYESPDIVIRNLTLQYDDVSTCTSKLVKF